MFKNLEGEGNNNHTDINFAMIGQSFDQWRDCVGLEMTDKNEYTGRLFYPWNLRKANIHKSKNWQDQEVMKAIASSCESGINRLIKLIKSNIASQRDQEELEKGKRWITQYQIKSNRL